MHELRYVPELFVNARESHVSDLVDLPKPLHHRIADRARGDFVFVLGFHYIDDILDQHRELFDIDRAFVTGGPNGAGKFFSVELFSAAITFDDREAFAHEELRGGKPVSALEAFSSPADRRALFADAGVDHLVFDGSALWTAHDFGREKTKPA